MRRFDLLNEYSTVICPALAPAPRRARPPDDGRRRSQRSWRSARVLPALGAATLAVVLLALI